MGSVGPNKMNPSLGIPRIGCLHASVGVKQSHSGSKIAIFNNFQYGLGVLMQPTRPVEKAAKQGSRGIQTRLNACERLG